MVHAFEAAGVQMRFGGAGTSIGINVAESAKSKGYLITHKAPL